MPTSTLPACLIGFQASTLKPESWAPKLVGRFCSAVDESPIPGCPFHAKPITKPGTCPVQVTTRGGGYFFAPSIGALKALIAPKNPLLAGKTDKKKGSKTAGAVKPVTDKREGEGSPQSILGGNAPDEERTKA